MYLETLQVALKNKYDTEFRNGTHVSDLVLCERKSIIRKLEPEPITMKELNYFTSGRAIHDAIATLAKQCPSFEIEKEINFNGIIGHVDLYDSAHNIPIECKSMRVKEVKQPKSHHIQQLKYYMAMLGANKGVILYQCLLNFDEKPFVEFEIEMSAKEREDLLDLMINQKIFYEKNLEEKTPMKADNVFHDPNLNWLCVNRDGKPNCPYYHRCKEQDSK